MVHTQLTGSLTCCVFQDGIQSSAINAARKQILILPCGDTMDGGDMKPEPLRKSKLTVMQSADPSCGEEASC